MRMGLERNRPGFVKLWQTLLCCIGVALAGPAVALADSARFDITVQPMPAALKAFAAQAHMQLLYEHDAVRDVTCNPVSGELDKRAALEQILRNTGLEAIYSSETAATVRPIGAERTSAAGSNPNAPDDNGAQGQRFWDRFHLAQVAAGVGSVGGASLANEPESALQEVLVTATRRTESLQTVPLAVTALSSEQVAALGLKDSFSIASQVPNMFVASGVGAHAVPLFSIRGVGTNDVYATSAPAVGVYYDDVVANSIFGQGIPLYDLDRVEVLRGPQGTLWGKNTTGGAINFISRAPSQELDGYGRVTYGSYDQRELEGAVGGGITDTLAGRASFFSAKHDGYWRNISRGTRVGDYNDDAFRAQLQWQPTDTLTARLILATRSEHELAQYSSHGLLPDGTDGLGSVDRVEDGIVQSDENSPTSIDTDMATLDVRWQFGSGLSLTSLTSYLKNDFHSQFDGDATGVTFEAGRQDLSVDQISQEVRLNSDPERRARWIVGLFFLRESLNGTNVDAYPDAPDFNTNRFADQTTRNAAGFANLEFSFTPQLIARAGLRYTRDQKHMQLTAVSYTPGPDYLNLAQASNFIPFDGPNDDRHTDKRFTWDATLEYHPTTAALLYGRIASGFKAGVYNTAVFAPGAFSLAAPEKLIDYEIGAKTQWLDGRVQANASAFLYDYRDYQIQIFITSNNAVYSNAPRVRIPGGELELTAKLTERLLAHFSAGYTWGEFRDFKNASVDPAVNSGIPLDVSGERLPRSPKGTASAMLQYAQPLGAGELRLQTDWNYVGKTNFDVWPDRPLSTLTPTPEFADLLPVAAAGMREPAYVLGNVRAAFAFGAGQKAEVALWCRNVTDKFYRVNRYSYFFIDSIGFNAGVPRTYGASMTYRFGK